MHSMLRYAGFCLFALAASCGVGAQPQEQGAPTAELIAQALMTLAKG